MFKFKASLEIYFDCEGVKDEVYEVVDSILNGDDAKDYVKEDFYKNRFVDRFEVKKEAMKRISWVWDGGEIDRINNIGSYMTKDDIKLEIKSIVEDYVDESVDDLCHDMDISLRS